MGRERFLAGPVAFYVSRVCSKGFNFPLELAAVDVDNDDPDPIAVFWAQMRAWMFKHVGKTHSF